MNLRTNSRSLMLGTVAALALLVGCGGAETSGTAGSSLTVATGPQAEAGQRFRHAPDPAQMVQRFDANHDGSLQLAELPPRMQERLGAADANHDGVIAVEEITAHRAARRAEHFARIDTNHDGVVTVDEVGAERWTNLSAADADHDSRVTQAELTTAFESGALRGARGHHGMGPHGMGHRGMGPDGMGPGGPGGMGPGGPEGMGPGGPEGMGPGGREGMGRGMGRFHRAPDPARMIQRFDANGDGALQVSEMPPRMQEHMADADADHNGAITEAELSAAIARRRAEHPMGPMGPMGPNAPVAPVAPAAQK